MATQDGWQPEAAATEGMGAVAKIVNLWEHMLKGAGMTQRQGWSVRVQIAQGEATFILLSQSLPTEEIIRTVAGKIINQPVVAVIQVARSVPVVEMTDGDEANPT